MSSLGNLLNIPAKIVIIPRVGIRGLQRQGTGEREREKINRIVDPSTVCGVVFATYLIPPDIVDWKHGGEG